MAKMNNKMIALCSAAVGSLYLTGFVLTDTSHAEGKLLPLGQKQSAAMIQNKKKSENQSKLINKQFNKSQIQVHKDKSKSIAPSKQVSEKSSQQKRSPKLTSSSSPQTTNSHLKTATKPTSPHNKLYKDGTYYGQASSWNGGVQVGVTTKNDKIVDVKITQCTTSYSESNIASLPQAVMSKQSANINLVSGATESSTEFRDAVEQALAKAKI